MDGGKMSLSQTIIYGIVFSLMFFLYVVCLQDRDMFTLNPNKKSVDIATCFQIWAHKRLIQNKTLNIEIQKPLSCKEYIKVITEQASIFWG